MRNTLQDRRTIVPEWSTKFIQTTKAVLCICLLIAVPVARAQGVSGRIVGTVMDATGAVIPNSTLTISNQDTGAITKVTTNGNGQYRADTLRPGNYQLKVESPGLQTMVSNGNVVTVDNATVVDITMRVGSTSDTVVVSSASPLIDTTSSSLGETLYAQEITSLPLNGRVFSQLVQTVPGSVAAGFGSAPEAAAGAGSSGSITASVNGMPWGGTTYTLDGVNNMELLNAFINVPPPLDAIQEMKISTNNADITVGTYGGAQVNAFLKSGTNAFHGSAYEFFRDDALSA
jgi:outer membrane lipoprotein-sorting protein